MSKLVFIYSLERETATKISDWTNDSSGKKLKKVKIGRCVDQLMALYSPKVGGLANYISYTPYIDPETGTPAKDEKGNTIMLQAYLEKKWNKPEGYFTNRAWMNGDSLKEEDFTYFQRKSWRLNDGCTILNLNHMDDEIGYYVFLASSLVANSEAEWRAHKWPRAQYYIALENESEQIKHKKSTTKVKAFAALASSDLTEPIKRKFVSLLELANSKTSLTLEQIDNLLYEYIDKSTFLPGSNIDKFNDLVRLFETATGREEFEARWIIKQALDNRIIYEKQGTYTWPRVEGKLVLGERYAEAIDFILNPKKQQEVEDLLAEIKNKINN